MKRPWSFRVLIPLLLVVVGAVSCDRILRQFRNDDGPAVVRSTDAIDSANEVTTDDAAIGVQELTTRGNTQELINQLAGVKVTLPSSWSAAPELHNAAELEAADPQNQLYLVVVAEDAERLMRLGLRENAANYRALLASRLAQYESETPTGVEFINGNYASQYEIRGQLEDGTPVVYLHTTVLADGRYYQIVAWTSPEQYEAHRSELQSITETFQEIRA